MTRALGSITATLALLCPAAPAQQDVSSRLRPITAPVRKVSVRIDGATGRAVRTPPTGHCYDWNVYANTCASGYYATLLPAAATGGSQSQALVDQGRVPSWNSPATPFCGSGAWNSYGIDFMQIAYCTTTGAPVDFVSRFWNNNGAACPSNFGTVPDESITAIGLPRSAAAGTLACYLVTMELATPGFTLNGGRTDDTAGRFAWSMQYPRTTGGDGPLVAGNPSICTICTGTEWEAAGPSTNPGTGLGAVDSFWQEDFGATSTGCSYFGGNPFAAFHLLLAFRGQGPPPFFCNVFDGASALCPCGSSQWIAGCDIAQGPGVFLEVQGLHHGPNSATLIGTGYPPAAMPTAVVIRSNDREPVPVSFYDGLRCVGLRGLVRLAATTASGGVSTHVIGHAAGSGFYYYQLWFRNTPVSYCVTTGPGMGAGNLSNGTILCW